jgi:hypothetical protein
LKERLRRFRKKNPAFIASLEPAQVRHFPIWKMILKALLVISGAFLVTKVESQYCGIPMLRPMAIDENWVSQAKAVLPHT